MAVRVQFVTRLSKVTGFAPASWERITGYLANAGYTPKGQAGGGIGAAHYQVEHIVSGLLGGSAHVPSEAPAAVMALEHLRATPPNALASLGSNYKQNVFIQPGTSLRDYLEQQVSIWANPSPAMLKTFLDEEAWLSTWTLELSPSMPWACLSEFRPGVGSGVTMFQPEHLAKDPPSGRRKLDYTLPVLKVAGELLADTLAKQPTLIPDPVPGRTGEGDADPETMKAAGPGSHDGLLFGRSARRAYSARVQTAPSQEQSTAPQGSKQLASGSGGYGSQGLHQPATTRTSRHGAYWPDAATP